MKKEEVPIYKQRTQSSEEPYMAHRTLEPAFDIVLVSRRIAWKAADEEKPYHRIEKCAQNDGDRIITSFCFFPCELFHVKYE